MMPAVPPARPEDAVPGPPLPELAAPWSVRVARPEGEDLDTIHRWMLQDHVVEFWQQPWERSRWAEEIAGQQKGDHSLPCLVSHDGTPVAYVEIYRVLRDRLAEHYPHHAWDLGVHIAIGDRGRTGRGLGRELLRALAGGLLAADPHCRRIVAEPDVRNIASLRAFQAAGYLGAGHISLPEKKASLHIYPSAADSRAVAPSEA